MDAIDGAARPAQPAGLVGHRLHDLVAEFDPSLDQLAVDRQPAVSTSTAWVSAARPSPSTLLIQSGRSRASRAISTSTVARQPRLGLDQGGQFG